MDVTLTRTDDGIVQVVVDDSPSHTFDLAPLIPEGYHPEQPFLQDPAQHGARLFSALFPPHSPARQALAAMDAGPAPGTIRLTPGDPTTRAVPWECVCDEGESFLVTRHRFVRGLPPEQRREVPADIPAGDLQLLAVPASPLCRSNGTPERPLDVRRDVESVAGALRTGQIPFRLRLVSPPTLDGLQRARRHPPTLLHFAGHGEIARGTAGLFFEDEAGVAERTPAQRLLKRMGEGLFLVFLSGCRSLDGSWRAFNGMAHDLVAGRVPYALAAVSPAVDPLAGPFLETFYTGLGQGLPVEEATRQARLTLEAHPRLMVAAVLYAAQAGEGAAILTGGRGQPTITLEAPPPRLTDLSPAGRHCGYRAELAMVGIHWRAGTDVVTLAGEDGVGKTSLAVEAIGRFGWRFPDGILDLALNPLPELPTLLARLAEWAWGDVPPEPWDEPAMVDAIAHHLRQQHRLLVLDDYDPVIRTSPSGDNPVAGLLSRLVSELRGGNTRLLVTACRPTAIPGEQVVPLEGLSSYDGAALFRSLASGTADGTRSSLSGCDEDRLVNLSQRIGGHPLALRLLSGIYSTGQASLEELARRVVGRFKGAAANGLTPANPTALGACLSIALEALPPDTRSFLPYLMIFSAPFPTRVATDTFNDPKIAGHLQALSRARLLRQTAIEAAGERIWLYHIHPGVRRLLHAQMDTLDLAPLRPRFVAAYANVAGDDDFRSSPLGTRLAHATRPDLVQAMAWADEQTWVPLALAVACLRRNDGLFDAALRLYRDILTVQERRADLQGKRGTLHEMAQVYRLRGDLATARRLYERSVEISESLADRRAKSNALYALAHISLVQGDAEEAIHLHREALVLQKHLEDRRGQGATLHAIASIHHQQGDLESAMERYQEAVDIYNGLGDPAGKSSILQAMADIYRRWGNLDKALWLYREALERSEAAGDRQGRRSTLQAMGHVHRDQGRLEEAQRLYEQALVIDEMLGNQRGASATLRALGRVSRLQGDLSRAMRFYHRSLLLQEASGDARGKGATLKEMATVHTVQGDLDAAQRLYERALAIEDRLDDQQSKSVTLYGMATVHVLRGKLAQAEKLYHDALTLKDSLGEKKGRSAILNGLATIHGVRGELDQAQRLHEQALQIDDDLEDEAGRGATLHGMATIHLVRGELAQAKELYEAALVIRERLADQRGRSATLLGVARVYRLWGNLDRAHQLYAEALAISEELEDQRGRSIALHEVAHIHHLRGDLDRAMQLYGESLVIKEALGDQRGRSATLQAMAYVYTLWGNLGEAERLCQRALKIDKRLGDQQGRGATLHALAHVYRVRGNLDEALQLYEESLAIDEALGDRWGQGATRHEMAGLFAVWGNLDEAQRLYQEALAIKETLGDPRGKSATLHEMAALLATTGDVGGAQQLYEKALKIDEALGDKRGISATLHEMAYVQTLWGNLDEAARLYQEALAIQESLGDQRGRSATLHEMATVHVMQGDLEEAMRLYGKSLAIKEALGEQQGWSATLAMMGQLLAHRGERHAAVEAFHAALSTLLRLRAAPDVERVGFIIAHFCRQIGRDAFEALWADVTGGEPLPPCVPAGGSGS